MVSVIIPVYNREKVILKAVESVLQQTYSDIELIIIDDGSTDNLKSVIKGIKDKRVRYIYQENSGACVARNKGIDAARGEYIAFHDSDDIWHEDKLEKQLRIFKINDADLVFCKLNEYKNGAIQKVLPNDCSGGFLESINNLFGIGTQTLIAKKDVFKKCMFDPEMPRFQEFELLLRISKKYRMYCLDEGLVNYYIGDDSISSNPQKLYRACEMILHKHPDFKKNYPKMISIMGYKLLEEANIMLLNGENPQKLLDAAYSYNGDKKILIKAFLNRIHLYRFMLK